MRTMAATNSTMPATKYRSNAGTFGNDDRLAFKPAMKKMAANTIPVHAIVLDRSTCNIPGNPTAAYCTAYPSKAASNTACDRLRVRHRFAKNQALAKTAMFSEEKNSRESSGPNSDTAGLYLNPQHRCNRQGNGKSVATEQTWCKLLP